MTFRFRLDLSGGKAGTDEGLRLMRKNSTLPGLVFLHNEACRRFCRRPRYFWRQPTRHLFIAKHRLKTFH